MPMSGSAITPMPVSGQTVRLGSFHSRYFEFASAPIVGVSQALIGVQGEAARGNNEFFVFGAARGRGVLYQRSSTGRVQGVLLHAVLLGDLAGSS